MRYIYILVIFALGLAGSVHAQAPFTTDDFINLHFQVQNGYSHVLCVSQDGTCPTEVEVSPPCLTATCTFPVARYPIAQTFETIQAAADVAEAGDLVIITDGHYAGVEIEEKGGSDGGYIHFLGWGEHVVIDSSADPSKSYLRHHFYFINAHHYILQNLKFENAEEGAGIFVSGYFSATGSFSHHFIVMDVYSHDNGVWGMHTTATNDVLIQHSVFTNSGEEHGVYVSGSGDNMIIRDNIFQGNNSSGLQVNADPQTATSELFYWLQNSTGNTCEWSDADVEFTGAATWHDIKACYDSQGLPDLGEFIEDGISQNLIIENNIITANGSEGGAGINLASVRNSTIRNNLIYGNFAAAIACWDNAYDEEKGLSRFDFACQNVQILNNTLVDEGGNRGSLILTTGAMNFQVQNNIILRDRMDAYEISMGAGPGFRSSNNAYTELYLEEAPEFTEDVESRQVSLAEGLAQFINPNFELWIIPEGDNFSLNPNRPDYHLRPDSIFLSGGTAASPFDLLGNPRGAAELGALSLGDGVAAPPVESSVETSVAGVEPVQSDLFAPVGTLAFTLNTDVFLMHNGETQNISQVLDALSPGEDTRIDISSDGNWILMETTRFDPECAGWSCWVILDRALTTPQVVVSNGAILHATDSGAIGTNGEVIVYPDAGNGAHASDLFLIRREGEAWSAPLLLTENSPYDWNSMPSLSDDNSRVVFDCGNEPYGGAGTAICEVNTDGSGFREVIAPSLSVNGVTATALHHPDYAPDGSIVFEGDWMGEQIWRFVSEPPQVISASFINDNSPCVLPNGTIVSLWLGRPEGQTLHEIKVMSPDGAQYVMPFLDQDIADIGISCGN